MKKIILSCTGFLVRDATPADGDAMMALMPRLADFDVPASRNPEHLYKDDVKLLRRWIDGKEECLAHVAITESQSILGFSLVRLRPELLSHEPSAHLEAIAVDEGAEGIGVAKALLDVAERSAKANGARTMTLHVFASNVRARNFYDRAGYDGELMRYIKDIT
jgi:ribosomal protein S18 acetylase RimI-like enzyme